MLLRLERHFKAETAAREAAEKAASAAGAGEAEVRGALAAAGAARAEEAAAAAIERQTLAQVRDLRVCCVLVEVSAKVACNACYTLRYCLQLQQSVHNL